MIIKGHKVLAHYDHQKIIISKLNKVYLFDLKGNKKELLCKFPITFKSFISNYSLALRRLFRSDIRYGFLSSDNLILVKSGIFRIFNLSKREWIESIRIPRGSRPLNMVHFQNVDGFTNGIYFGEYFSNPSKEECHIYRLEDSKLEKVYTFPKGKINHIHNLIVDRFQNCIWILVGDFDDSAAIYKATNDFNTVERICYGSQQYRSCVAYPTEKGLVYATDSQFEQNKICLLHKIEDQWTSEILHEINGPCIYGTKIDKNQYFSTAVEAINSGNRFKKYLRNKKGPGIIKNQTEIIEGSLDSGYKTIYSNKKDNLPFMLFQFGNILFPSGINKTGKLIFTNIGSKKHDFSTIIKSI